MPYYVICSNQGVVHRYEVSHWDVDHVVVVQIIKGRRWTIDFQVLLQSIVISLELAYLPILSKLAAHLKGETEVEEWAYNFGTLGDCGLPRWVASNDLLGNIREQVSDWRQTHQVRVEFLKHTDYEVWQCDFVNEIAEHEASHPACIRYDSRSIVVKASWGKQDSIMKQVGAVS